MGLPEFMVRWLLEMRLLILREWFTVRIFSGFRTIVLVWLDVGVHLVRLWRNYIVVTCEKRFMHLIR